MKMVIQLHALMSYAPHPGAEDLKVVLDENFGSRIQ